jgi:hypothetical protein
MPRMGLVKMTAEQRTTDTASDCAEKAPADRIAQQRATRATSNCADCSVSATTAVIVIPVLATINMMTCERGRGQDSRQSDHCGHRGNANFMFHLISLYDDYSKPVCYWLW